MEGEIGGGGYEGAIGKWKLVFQGQIKIYV